MVRPARVRGRCHVETTAGLVLIVISLLEIVFIVRVVQANMPK